MEKKLLAIIVLAVIASLSIAGCTSPTSSSQAAGTTTQATPSAAPSSASASASATPTATPSPTASPSIVPTASPTPTPTPTPSPTYEVQISGSVINNTGYFYATVTNSAGVYQTLNWQLNWFLNGQLAGGTWTPSGGITVPLTPGVQYTVTATYLTPAQWPNVGSTLATSAPYPVTG
jgi:hypothetical protein